MGVPLHPPNSSVVNNFRFPGQYYDAETGLYYNWHRFYDPKMGRYVSADPIGLEGGINLYTYVLNNPIKLVDPEGLWDEDVHYGNPKSTYGTYTWALRAGFSERESHLIALGNNSADWTLFSSPITAGFGNQARHFNQFSNDEFCDSREYYADKELRAAVELFKKSKEDQAFGRLGLGLHSLQDLFAHRDFDTGLLGIKTHLTWYDKWDDPRNANVVKYTEKASIQYLNAFIRMAYGGYTH